MPSKPTKPSSILLSLFLLITSTTTVLSASSQGQADLPGKVDPNEHCPPSAPKQCCTSLKQPTEDLTDGLGELLPLASGIDVSSLVGIGCMFFPSFLFLFSFFVFGLFLVLVLSE